MFESFQDPVIDLRFAADESYGPAVNYLTFVLPLITALVISMVIIPVMVRLAPALGMIDKPDPRKVHSLAVPRVGGFGMVIGALVSVILMLTLDYQLQAFVIGALVLFGFGVLDDCKELGHYVKFIGQFIAVVVVVYFGDVYVTLLPFMGGEPVAAPVGKVFTVIAMVGMINAINHSDGLDGLAGGESLLSLACISWLAWLAGDETVIIIAMATAGGAFGFMRFNTYPAKIFMGDGGSQFLGYTLGYLTVVLTQEVNPALSPALPALVLGLPIADIIAVFIQRIYKKMNWFKASRNHIHHRLLDLGFLHYESVMLIYSIQALLVLLAVLMPYESDGVILGVYLAVITTVFLLLYIAEHTGWHMHTKSDAAEASDAIELSRYGVWLTEIPYLVVFYGIAVFLIAGAFLATDIPLDFTVIAMVLFILMLLRLLLVHRVGFLPLRFLSYVTIVFVVYLLNTYQPVYLSGADPLTYGFFGVLVVAIALAIRFSNKFEFNVTPMDLLIVLAVLSLAGLASKGIVSAAITAIILKSIILFYGSELIYNKVKTRMNLFGYAVLASLLVVGVRGILMHVL
ncbi:MAG TPA: MraY family glycosyltransferase [Gammaproteobacteria bacterium]|nr:MraY family glycosyltransferase [Gammaproteobacteria bacterium]